jgi:hypothetical protein
MARPCLGRHRIAVYGSEVNPNTAPAMAYISRSKASRLLDLGKAVEIGKGKIQVTADYQHPARPRFSGHQGTVYESAAIEPHLLMVNGGLTRDEHQPAPVKRN